METVERFLQARREGRVDDTLDMLAPNALVGSPWGGNKTVKESVAQLRLEPTFYERSYLDPRVPIVRVDDFTFTRCFRWNRLMGDLSNHNSLICGMLPVYRETYFVKDGRIRAVSVCKLMRGRSAVDFLRYCGLYPKVQEAVWGKT